MKRFYIFTLAFILCLTGIAMAHIVPEKPVPARKMYAIAEEIVEGEENVIGNENNVVENGDNIVEYEGDEINDICISVIGNASKSLSPDCATVYAVIETLDSDMVKSKDDNFDKFQTIISALKELQIEEDAVTLDYFSSYPNYDYSSSTTLVGYLTSLNFSIKLNNLDNVKSVVDLITENGVTCIQDIKYQVSNMDEEYEEVLKQAVDNAKSKASKLLNKEDLKVVKIKEESVYFCSDLYRNYAEELESSNLLGKIEIKARVNVIFE